MARLALIDIDDLLQLSLEDLRRVWDDLPELYQDSLLCHPRTPPLLLWRAVKTDPWRMWRLCWARNDIPQELAWDLIIFSAFKLNDIYRELVRHPSVTPDMLLVLTELGDSSVRCDLLDHKNVTDEVLERLAHDPHSEIRREATKKLRARWYLCASFKGKC